MKTLNNIFSFRQFFSIAIILLVNLWFTAALHAQNVGVNNPAPHIKALMDLTSSDKGLLTPRMTLAQKNAMFPVQDASASGMLIYQTDGIPGFYYYDGVTWNYLSSNKPGWSLTGNAGTDSLLNFLGTTDNQPLVIKTANNEKVRVMVNGNTGIGTGTPLQKLHVDGNVNLSNDTNNIRINNVRVFSVKGSGNLFAGETAGINNTTGFRNTALGSNSLGSSAIGEQNTAIGFNSLYSNTTGNWNAAAGAFSLYANTTGYNNVAFGNAAGMDNTTGSGNTFIGEDAGRKNITGWFNTFTGLASGFYSTTGEYNTADGAFAGYSLTTGHRNTFLGSVSGNKTTTGSWNTNVGVDAGRENITGHGNVHLGFEAGLSSTSANDNTMLGIQAGKFNMADMNTFVGAHSGYNNTTGYNNTFLGRASGVSNTTGFENTFLGGYAGWKNTTGFDNAFVGRDAGLNNLTGNSNVFVGEVSGIANTTGSLNTFIGQAAGFQTTTGNNNTFIGRNAGSANVTGTMNVALGEMAQVGSGLTNAIAIGAGSSVITNNSIALGGTGSLAVNVGIGTSAPVSRLHVVSANTVPLSLQNTAAGGYSGLHTMNASMALTGHLGYANPGAATFADQFYVGSITAIPFVLTTGNTEKMRIDATGNVGIGITNPTSKLHIVSNTISVPLRIQNTLNNGYSGMHLHNNTGTLMGHMGFANPASGSIANTMYFGSIAPAPVVITTSDVERVRVDATGNMGIGTTAPTAKLEVNGFTKLGTDAPAIKVKKLTGTTGSFQGGSVSISHGLNIAKILSVQVLVEKTATNLIPPANTTTAGDEFNFRVTTSVISVTNTASNSINILSKPVRILITYEE